MNSNEKIRDLQRQIEAEKSNMLNCNHIFGEPVRDDEVKREPYGYKTVGQGSDVWTEPEGYHDVSVKRWSRTCQKCGKVEYTYNTEPVIKEYKPKF